MKNNTYIQDKDFKDMKFSEGEFLTELDLDIIEDRTSTFYITDEEYERYLSEENDAFIVQNWNDFELQYNSSESFTIGNNIAGGI